MSERTHYPAGVPCWVDTTQPDPDRAIAFYEQLFGWEFTSPGPMPTEPAGRYHVARLRGRDAAGVSSMPPGLETGATWSTYVAVDSADAVAERAGAVGGSVLVAPFDAPPAGRMAVLSDPAGATFCVWQADQRQGAQVVNEPSAWAMSTLMTDDRAAAAAFYGELFGWELEPFGDQMALWRLPGFVGGEPQQPVPRDVVAVAAAVPSGAKPGWSVGFWIEDADRAAAQAAEQGGAVVVAPHEDAGFKTTVLADPAGAMLSVSQLLQA